MISTDFAPNESTADAVSSLITLLSPWAWMEGRERGQVQSALAKFFPGGNLTLFLSGRGALSLLLGKLGFPEGSEVMMAGFTCEAVAVPVLANRLRPVYVDIERSTFSLDPVDLKRKLTSRTRAVILQHTFGLVPENRDRVLQLAREKNILVIEDLAHGFDPAFWQRQKLSDNQVLTLSFGRSKALSSVFGGALVTADPALAGKIGRAEESLPFPDRGFLAKLLFYKPLSFAIKASYNIGPLGKILHKAARGAGLMVAEISRKEKRGEYDPYLEKKYPNALAILLLQQLEKFAAAEKTREISAGIYARELSGSVQPPYGVPRFPYLVKNKKELLRTMADRGIYLGNWYSQPVAPADLQLSAVGYTMGNCPAAEEVCRQIINLPTRVSKDEAEQIARLVKEYADKTD